MSNPNTVFVGGVKACFSRVEILNYFSQFGTITSVKMKKNKRKNNTNRGFCLIRFEHTISARRVIEIKNHTIDGRMVTCREYLKGEKLKKSKIVKNNRRLYISNLAPETTNAQIMKVF